MAPGPAAQDAQPGADADEAEVPAALLAQRAPSAAATGGAPSPEWDELERLVRDLSDAGDPAAPQAPGAPAAAEPADGPATSAIREARLALAACIAGRGTGPTFPLQAAEWRSFDTEVKGSMLAKLVDTQPGAVKVDKKRYPWLTRGR